MDRIRAAWLGVLGILAFVPVVPATAQTVIRLDDYSPVDASGRRFFRNQDSTIVAWDMDSGREVSYDLRDFLRRIPVNATPGLGTIALEPGGEYAWVWDRSVGSVARIGVGRDTSRTYYFSSSTQSQFDHAAGLHPVSRTPIAFGGYGHYRAKDFLLMFSPQLDSCKPPVNPIPLSL